MIENLKKVYRDNSEIDFDTLWNEGTFIFDTNVLLDLYRLPETARNDLLNVLKDEKFNPRIWAAFQVLLEFVNNRYSVISDQKNKFTKVKKLLEKAKSKYEEAFNDLNNGLDEL